MKIYSKIVFSLEDSSIISESSFDYSGPLVELKGGGGGGGGSGRVDYPDYMKTQHGEWLGDLDTLINAASNPFTGAVAYDPDTAITAGDTAICAFNTLVDAMDHNSDWQVSIAAVTSYLDASVFSTVTLTTPTPAAEAEIEDSVQAFSDQLDDQITATVIPRLELGYRDAGAALTSAFVIGRALVEEGRNKDVAKYSGDLRIQAFIQKDKILADNIDRKNMINAQLEMHRRDSIIKSTDRALIDLIARVEFERHVATLTADFKRVQIVAKSEETKQNYSYDEAEALFPMEIYQYAGNMMASIGGGAVTKPAQQPTAMQTALNATLMGATAGAGIGALVQNPLVGAGIGAGVGLFGNLLGLW